MNDDEWEVPEILAYVLSLCCVGGLIVLAVIKAVVDFAF